VLSRSRREKHFGHISVSGMVCQNHPNWRLEKRYACGDWPVKCLVGARVDFCFTVWSGSGCGRARVHVHAWADEL
jgi:hypothetical protein